MCDTPRRGTHESDITDTPLIFLNFLIYYGT